MQNNLIFSTKGLYGKGLMIFLIIILICCCPIFMVDSIISKIVIFGYTVFCCAIIGREWGLHKSFLDLYDDHIEGKTIPKKLISFNGSSNEMQSFELKYSEITQITYKKYIVIIHFAGGEYQCQAKNVEQKVVNLIRNKKQSI